MRYAAWVWLLLAAAGICWGADDWQLPDGELTFSLPVPNTDVIMVRK